ncbi:MAG: alpha/beta fold hydrolase [Hyphomicrobiales bacterium]
MTKTRTPVLPALALAGAISTFVSLPDAASGAEAHVLGHEVYGTGAEKVILLHDWMGDAQNYAPLKAYLDAQAFTYVFADVRGYGRSIRLKGAYTAGEVASDVVHLADHLGFDRFHVVGHSMNGMTVQRLAIDDWTGGAKRLKSLVAITPVSADGYPASEEDRSFLWAAIDDPDVAAQAFGALTGGKLGAKWAQMKVQRNIETSDPDAMKGYYKMWLDTDFSAEAAGARVATPMLVIGGRNDLPGFQEPKLRASFGQWYPNAELTFITDAGHYPMQETPAYLAAMIEGFLGKHAAP